MKKLVYVFIPILALSVSFTACKKDETTTPTTPTPTPTPNPAPTPFTPTPGNVDGALVAIQMDYTTDQPVVGPVAISYEMGVAAFYDAPGSSNMVDAGTVKVNTVDLKKESNNSYFVFAGAGMTPSTLDLDDNGVDWNVGGAGSVAGFTYTHAGNFPDYTGTVPSSVTKANGLSFTFNSSSVSAADSVYVFIAGGNNNTYFLKGYAPNAGTVNISASELSNLPTITDNTGIIEVLPVKFATPTINGKKYAFIKEKAIVKNININ